MRVEQRCWRAGEGWRPASGALGSDADLLLVFGGTSALVEKTPLDELQRAFPKAMTIGCTTAGEICDTRVSDESIVATAIAFDGTRVHGAATTVSGAADSHAAGERIAASLPHGELVHVLVLSDGIHVNGSELVHGLTSALPPDVTVTGGLSGDGDRFETTRVVWEGEAREKTVAAVGLYGSNLSVGYGSLGGWDPFGPERLVTRSEGHVLYELDGRSALDLYKEYLGEHAAGLPATGLLFPLSIRTSSAEKPVVRTILSCDEQESSMTFAGDVPQGSYARLMKANFNRLLDGATGAARTCDAALAGGPADLALLISCVGRKLVLRQRIEEEVESVRDVLGARPVMTGFYSYGEISPFTPNARCELHNQTMTITTLKER